MNECISWRDAVRCGASPLDTSRWLLLGGTHGANGFGSGRERPKMKILPRDWVLNYLRLSAFSAVAASPAHLLPSCVSHLDFLCLLRFPSLTYRIPPPPLRFSLPLGVPALAPLHPSSGCLLPFPLPPSSLCYFAA